MFKSALYITGFLLSIVVLSANVVLSGYIATDVEGIQAGDTGVLLVDTQNTGFSELSEILSSKPNQILVTEENYDYETTGYQPIASHEAERFAPESAFSFVTLSGYASFNLAPSFGSTISAGDAFALVVFTNSNTSGNDVLIFSEADWLVPSDGSLSTYSNDLTQLNDISVPSQTYSYPVSESTEDNSNQSDSTESEDTDSVSESTEDNSNQSDSTASEDTDSAGESTEEDSVQSDSTASPSENLTSAGSRNNVWYSDSVDLGNDWRWTYWLGYFNVGVESFIYHSEHKWLYVYQNAFRSDGVYFRDDLMGSILWTSENVYPFLYRFSDGEWIWYQKDSKDPRWFNKLSKDQWEQY